METAVSVRRFHKPLADAGIVPENCRLLEMSIGVSGAFVVRYEVFLTAPQLVALGGIFQIVGEELMAERTDAGRDAE